MSTKVGVYPKMMQVSIELVAKLKDFCACNNADLVQAKKARDNVTKSSLQDTYAALNVLDGLCLLAL